MPESGKRQALRKYSNYVVEFYNPEGSLLMGVGRLLDLSASGALVESNIRVIVGQTLMLRLRRGDRANLELSATVIRARNKGSILTYGLKFNRD